MRLRPTLRPGALWVLVLFTGAAGLVYEVVWTRLLARPLGSGWLATGTVLGVFLAGLSLGAVAAGRTSLLRSRPLLLCGLAEAGTGLWALLLPQLLRWVAPLLLHLHPGGGVPGGGILRVALVGALILPPALLMGATFPALVEAASRSGRHGPGREGGAVYAANTVGAGAGAALAAFLLLPVLGMWKATLLAAIADLVASAVLIWARPVPPPSEASLKRVMEMTPGRTGPVLLALLLSGAATLALEIVWARTLGMLLGTSVYALGTVLATFVVGLGIGAGIAAARKGWLAGRESARRLLAGSLALGALLTFVAHALVPLFPGLVSSLSEALIESPRLLQLAGAGICAAILLPAAVALGAAFPAGLALVAGGEGSAGRAASLAYAASAVGSLAGSLAAAAWAVPALGLRGTVVAAVLLQLAGAAAALRSGGSTAPAWIGIGAAALLSLILPVRWAPERIASGPFLYGPRIQGEVLFHRDGREATVTVARDGPWLSMRVNGKVDASTRGDLETQRFLAHLGILLHEAPRDVLVIGLASGITAGSVLTHPGVERVTCVELEPAVVEASSWFRAWNGTALGDPRLELVVGDGRAHMARHRGAYDLVVSEPSNPWMAGVADLFTREAFEAANRSLREDGIFVQWVQAYGLEPEDIRAVVRTFHGVFPEATLWAVGRDLTDLALVGGPGVERDLDRVRSVLDADGAAAQELRLSGIVRPADLIGRLLVAGEGMEALAGPGPVLRDDHPWLEYTGPLHVRDVSLYGRNLRLLRGARARPWQWFDLRMATAGEAAALHRARERFLDALEAVARGDDAGYESSLREALALDPGDADAARLLARLHTSRGFKHLEEGRAGAAYRELEDATRADPFYPVPHLALGALYERQGELAAAALRYEAYLRLYPFDPDGWSRLAAVYAAMGEAEQAALASDRARSLRPGPPSGIPGP